jgi:hypothetical protein
MTYCTHCGNSIEPDAKFCTGCGHPVPYTAPEPVTPSPAEQQLYRDYGNNTSNYYRDHPLPPYSEGGVVPLLLTIFLGFIGIIIAYSLDKKRYLKQGAAIAGAVFCAFEGFALLLLLGVTSIFGGISNTLSAVSAIGSVFIFTVFLPTAIQLIFTIKLFQQSAEQKRDLERLNRR